MRQISAIIFYLRHLQMKKAYKKAEIRVLHGLFDVLLSSGTFYLDENDDFTVNDIFEGWWLR